MIRVEYKNGSPVAVIFETGDRVERSDWPEDEFLEIVSRAERYIKYVKEQRS